jgi:hypothetical protein
MEETNPLTLKARLLLVNIYVHHAKSWFDIWLKHEDLPKDFLYDLSKAYAGKDYQNSDDDCTKMNFTCKYHLHGVENDEMNICNKYRSNRRHMEVTVQGQ